MGCLSNLQEVVVFFNWNHDKVIISYVLERKAYSKLLLVLGIVTIGVIMTFGLINDL